MEINVHRQLNLADSQLLNTSAETDSRIVYKHVDRAMFSCDFCPHLVDLFSFCKVYLNKMNMREILLFCRSFNILN